MLLTLAAGQGAYEDALEIQVYWYCVNHIELILGDPNKDCHIRRLTLEEISSMIEEAEKVLSDKS